jgi:hypothetical protein
MSGAIPSLPQYALMAWCSVKAQGQLYLYLYHDITENVNCTSFKAGWTFPVYLKPWEETSLQDMGFLVRHSEIST